MRTETFDILIVGGGATGTGIAFDAATRGLNVGLIERADFSSETSSRSTKLLHGGVRYLENAFKKLDVRELELVRTALEERGNTLRNVPYLCHGLPILTPVYSWFEAAYLWTGFKLYDLLAQDPIFPNSRILSRKEVLTKLPQIQGKGLVGGLLYYDGQFDDARLNVVLAKSAYERGAAVANYVFAESIEKRNGKVVGVKGVDRVAGSEFEINAKVVMNATGAFIDQLRLKDEPRASRMVSASSGTHIILPAAFLPNPYGILIPKTKDGRVLFILPWKGKTLVGTTDEPHAIQTNPYPTEADISFILETVRDYYETPPQRKDILAVWTGLRPLVEEAGTKDTAAISRDHVIQVSESGLISVAGGKWTTYRKMAEECVDLAVQIGKLVPQCACRTENLKTVGAHRFTEQTVGELQRLFSIQDELAFHLAYHYGDRAYKVMEIARQGFEAPLCPGYPYIEAEVLYAIREEFAITPVDVLARRIRFLFLDTCAALKTLSQVANLMKAELKWDEKTKAQYEEETRNYCFSLSL